MKRPSLLLVMNPVYEIGIFLTETKLINRQKYYRDFLHFLCLILLFFHVFLNFCSIAHPNMITSDKNLAKNREDSWFNVHVQPILTKLFQNSKPDFRKPSLSLLVGISYSLNIMFRPFLKVLILMNAHVFSFRQKKCS